MTWQEFYNTYINLEPGILELSIRLLCAMLIGTMIGLEREFTHRPAGLRTHILVALGACVVSITGEMLFAQYSALGATPDPARLSAQVITGVGFLGAGTIMKEGATVKGLTTAASVWAVACLGLTSGFGYYVLALLGSVFMLITLTALEALQHRLIHVHSNECHYTVLTNDLATAMNRISATAQDNTATVSGFAAEQTESGHKLTFRIHFDGRRNQQHRQRFFDTLACSPEIQSIREADPKLGATV